MQRMRRQAGKCARVGMISSKHRNILLRSRTEQFVESDMISKRNNFVLKKWGHVSRLALFSGLYRMLPKELYSYLTLYFLQHSLDIFKVETLYTGDKLPDNRHSLAHTDRGILIRRSVVEENISDLWKQADYGHNSQPPYSSFHSL